MNQAVAIDAIEERLRALVLDNDLGREARIQAERYLAAMFTCFEDLAANPHLGRKRGDV